MSTIKWCSRCPRKIDKIIAKPAKRLLKKPYGNHSHFGTPINSYGICEANHYSKICRLRVEWKPCETCEESQNKLERKRNHMRAKIRMKEKIPSFLRDELDRFKAQMERKMKKRFEKQLRIQVREEVERHLQEIVEDGSFIQLPSPPSIPAELSPPSPPKYPFRKNIYNIMALDDSDLYTTASSSDFF